MRRPERRQGAGAAKFVGGKREMSGKVEALKAVRLEWKDGKMSEVSGSEFTLPADLVLLAMGFVSPVQSVLEAFGVAKDVRGNARQRRMAPAAMPPRCPRCLPRATCAAASRWWSGRYAKAASARAPWTNS